MIRIEIMTKGPTKRTRLATKPGARKIPTTIDQLLELANS